MGVMNTCQQTCMNHHEWFLLSFHSLKFTAVAPLGLMLI